MCNSACPYLILGATTREIAPDVLLAVHSPKAVAHFRGGVPTPQMQAEANARGRERADRMRREYIVEMGVARPRSEFSSEGLALLVTCPAPRSIAAFQAAGSRENAAK